MHAYSGRSIEKCSQQIVKCTCMHAYMITILNQSASSRNGYQLIVRGLSHFAIDSMCMIKINTKRIKENDGPLREDYYRKSLAVQLFHLSSTQCTNELHLNAHDEKKIKNLQINESNRLLFYTTNERRLFRVIRAIRSYSMCNHRIVV